jgi:hypothetical protein
MKSQTELPKLETAQDLQDAYVRLFKTSTHSEQDEFSLAQPYPFRYVPSLTTDNSNPKQGLSRD